MRWPDLDLQDLRRTLGSFPTGVVVVTAEDRDGPHGMTANTFTAVALDPPLVLISLGNRTRMGALLRRTRRYGLSILSQGQEDVAHHFAGKSGPAEVVFTEVDGFPLIAGAVAHLVCEVVRAQVVADHTLFIGRIVRQARGAQSALVYVGSRFHATDGPASNPDSSRPGAP